MERLQIDPFRPVLEIYAKDLREAVNDHEGWSEQMHLWYTEQCLPAVAAGKAYQAKCTGALSPEAIGPCRAKLAEAAALNAKVRDGFEALAVVLRRLKRAVNRAKDVLDPRNSEAMFRRLAELYRQKLPDCEAMSRLMGALGKRIDGDVRLFTTIAARVLTSGVQQIVPYTNIPLVIEAPSPQGWVHFGQHGFGFTYLDPDPNSQHQVNHFVAYFVVGARSHTDPAADQFLREGIAFIREQGQAADYRLGIVAAELGARIAAQPHLMNDLERLTREAVCEQIAPSAQANTPKPPVHPLLTGFRISAC